ncbi:restriction endonuclease [Methanobacterium alcaliphilum]|nr:restriction endonuclease [Methanobacterium alcaliphilum]MCK9151142.1 restriction endonuclease [Methanobacterium alcaliphilum]
MEKSRLVDFMAKVMEESGFKVYKDFRTSRHLIDIYGILPTILGDIGIVIACKNYEEKWNVGLDVLKEMEMVAKTLKASKVVIVTTSGYSSQAINYAARRNIKLIDREGVLNLAQKFSKKTPDLMGDNEDYPDYEEYEDNNEGVEVSYTPSSSSKGFFGHGKKGSLNRKRDRIKAWAPYIKSILSNTFVLILVVIGISLLITTIIQIWAQVSTGILGVIKIFLSAVLAYGLVFLVEEKSSTMLIKGTIVFFVSLLVSIMFILI